jgi:hypothetical protein
MSKQKKQTLATSIFLVLMTLNLILPTQAYARINLRKFVRSIRRGTSFVINLPSKATRFMGPVLGPIAADIISVNLGKNPRFGSFLNKARRINKISKNIEEQNRMINELKKIYRDEAAELNRLADQIRQTRRDLAAELIKGNITREEHLAQVADLEALASSYDAAADRLVRSGDRLNPAHIIKLLGDNFISSNAVKIRNLVNHELQAELDRVLNPQLIQSLIAGRDPNRFLDILLSGELDQLKDRPNFDFDKFRERLLNQIRQILKDDSEDLKNNWQERMQQLIVDEIERQDAQLGEETAEDGAESGENKPNTEAADESNAGTNTSGSTGSDDPTQCDSGYVYKPRTGRGCVQENCNNESIAHAHYSYTGDCICGSAGSINEKPDDPNKACRYDLSYSACPGCVYACVQAKQECPEMP